MIADYLESLGEAIFNALGVCRVGLAGDAAALAGCLAARGMTCPAAGPRDAWVIVATLDELVRGEHIPVGDGAHPVFVVCRNDSADGAAPLRARVEAAMIGHGYIKHPATTELFGYARLDASNTECWALFDFRPPVFADGDTLDRLKCERDLHSDMLREAGVRSDAHVVRYQLAATLVRPGDIVLDAACGLGYGSHVLACLSPAARVTGIDLSDWAVDFAWHNYACDRVDFRCGSLPEALDEVADASVDFVVSLETLEHVTDPQALLAAFLRVLKPGGRIFVSVPNDWADETGEDPNPHHLHVYDWGRVRSELAAHFLVESAWSLTASGCKTGTDRVWRPQPRKLEEISLEEAESAEGEWWLVCATKSPLAGKGQPYRETVHTGFQGTTHLVDFDAYYENPWLVHSMIELPWRIRDKAQLLAVSERVVDEASPVSADLGAGLTVTGWRLFEDAADDRPAVTEWLARIEDYLGQGRASPNPHVRRWCISLDYLKARLLESLGDDVGASRAYGSVLSANVLAITPTLGTKQADAALRAGLLACRSGLDKEAIEIWQAGLEAVFQCLRASPIEFIGNRERPYIFALNDLVEIADGAVRLGNALCVLHSFESSDPTSRGRRLSAVTKGALRTALADAQTLAHARLALVEQLSARLDQANNASTAAERLALGTQNEIELLAKQLMDMERVKASAEILAYQRLNEIGGLRSQLVSTEQAKAMAESLVIAMQQSLEGLSRQLRETEKAQRAAELIAYQRQVEVERLQVQLLDVEKGMAVAENLAIGRQQELMALGSQLSDTERVKESVEALAISRLADLEQLQARLSATEHAKEAAECMALSRQQEIMDLDRRNRELEGLKYSAETLARTRQSEIEDIKSILAATENAKVHAEALAISRLKDFELVSLELSVARQSLDDAHSALGGCNARIHAIESSRAYRLLKKLGI